MSQRGGMIGKLKEGEVESSYNGYCQKNTESLKKTILFLFCSLKLNMYLYLMTLSKILCKWKQDSVISSFLYLDSVFKNKHKLVHNQAPV